MNSAVVRDFPTLPGIYVFKNSAGVILYIGKAKCLRSRVKSYFSRQALDWKIQELIKEHDTIGYIVTHNEIEALLLEVQLIRQFKPKYNVLLKSGNPFVYLLITQDELPQLKLVRVKKEKGVYFGPFMAKQKARSVHDYLTRLFKLRLCKTRIDHGCLDYHMDICAGSCLPTFNAQEYKLRIMLAQELLSGNYTACIKLLNKQIQEHNKKLEFEKSKNLAQYMRNLETIFETLQAGFTETKYLHQVMATTMPVQHRLETKEQALKQLQELLKLEKTPVTIDCFDISHFQSSSIVGSCIRFTHGLPDKHNFRKFKIKTLSKQNDYAALHEIVTRRYKKPEQLPDIILIDGGKGQLNAVKQLFSQPVFVSLAKREELLFTPHHPQGIKLDIATPVGQLLIALRDYAHHFAVSYHQTLRSKALKV